LVILFTFLISHHLRPNDNLLSKYLASALLALYPGFAIWSVAGLETLLFTALLTVSFFCFVLWTRNYSIKAGLSYATFTALASLTRPEGPLFFILAIVAVIIFAYRHEGQLLKTIGVVILPVGLFGVIVGSHLLWEYLYYGYPLPNTYYLKVVHEAPAPLSQGYEYMAGFWATIGGWWLFWIPLSILFTRKQNVWVWYGWGCLFAWLYYIHRVNGDWMPHYRFFIPVLPLIFLFIQEMISDMLKCFRVSSVMWAKWIGWTMIFVLISWSFLNSLYVYRTQHKENLSS
jgi:hypothetical protein